MAWPGTQIGIVFFMVMLSSSCAPASGDAKAACRSPAGRLIRQAGTWVQPGVRSGLEVLPGITLLTEGDARPLQTSFCMPELADPYVTELKDSLIVSGTGQYYLAFQSRESLLANGPYEIIWNDYYYSDGTLMEGDRYYANSWDLKPTLWSASPSPGPKLWNPLKDQQAPVVVWYGGHMRPAQRNTTSNWPADNYSRDVFAFTEKEPGKWFSKSDSIFSNDGKWPRPPGNYLGHRYGHQIVGRGDLPPLIFYEEVTEVTPLGGPAVTQIFMDEMASPFQALGNPTLLVSPFNPLTGQPYPSTIREDGSVLVEGPLYFRFDFEGETWEAIGFSAGSYYAHYPAAFASRKVTDGLAGLPYRIDLSDDASDLHDAGAELGALLNLMGGPGRPSVVVDRNGDAIRDADGNLRLLVHAYRKDYFPEGATPDQMFRVVIQANLTVRKKSDGSLRFDINVKPSSKTSF